MAGVRIALPSYPFQDCEFEPPPEWNFTRKGQLSSPIPLGEAWTSSHFIVPQFLDRKHFGGQVRYTDGIQEVYDRSVSVEKEGAHTRLSVERLFDLPRMKTKAWEFEKEYRFVLFILPAIPIPAGGPSGRNYEEDLAKHMLRCLLEGKGPALDHFDVRLASDALDRAAVTLGPCCTEGDRVVVEALLERFVQNGSYASSQLKGTIRIP